MVNAFSHRIPQTELYWCFHFSALLANGSLLELLTLICVAFVGARVRENQNFFLNFILPSLNELIFSDKLKVFKIIETLLKLDVAFRTMSIASWSSKYPLTTPAEKSDKEWVFEFLGIQLKVKIILK